MKFNRKQSEAFVGAFFDLVETGRSNGMAVMAGGNSTVGMLLIASDTPVNAREMAVKITTIVELALRKHGNPQDLTGGKSIDITDAINKVVDDAMRQN